MLNVEKKQIKTIDDYRHSIKLLKYHLKKQLKTNQKLKYEEAKGRHKQKHPQEQANQNKIYSLSDTVKTVSSKIKRMGMVLEDLFRMADSTYQGQINKEQFMKVVFRLKTNLQESLFTQMFYAIDTSLDGLISEQQFIEFSIAYGGCTNTKQIRKFEKKTKSKLGTLITKKYGSVSSFLEKLPNPIPINAFQKELKNLGLSDNETMLMMKTFDPSYEGAVAKQMFSSLIQKVKFKSQKEQKQEQYEKGIQQLCAYWRDHKLNPIVIFEEADVDGTEGVSTFQLEQAFKKLMPGQTNFQIKKWVSMINLNNDSEITKQEFLNSIRSFYSLNQMSKFSSQYSKLHPELSLNEKEESIQAIMKQLSIKIEDSGMTKKKTFDFIDFNKNGEISKQEMVQGLKRMGMDINFVGRVVSVFDRDSSGEISLEEWLRVLGEDIEVSDVGMPSDFEKEFMAETDKGEKAKNKSKADQKKIMKKSDVKKVVQVNDNKNKTVKNTKPQASKQNKNVTNKGSVSKPKQIIQNKGVIDKKFKEDEVKDSIIKQSANKTIPKNQKINEIVKKEQKPKVSNEVVKKDQKPKVSNKKSQKVIEKSEPPQQPQEQQENTDQIQEKIAQFYKQNKKKTLKQFQSRDKTSRGKLKIYEFNDAISKLCDIASIEANEPQIKQIFMKYCVSGSYLEYRNWLDEIKQLYAQDVESGQDESIKAANQQKFDQQQQPINDQTPEQQQQKPKQKPIEQKNKPIPKIEKSKVQKQKPKIQKQKQIVQTPKNQSVKRGAQIPGFQKLMSLSLQEGTKVDTGYKLVNYIDNSANNLKEQRDKLINAAVNLKKNGKKFVDSKFPPQKKSLMSISKQSNIANMTLIKWKHCSQIFKEPQLFVGSIEPNDILQGGLGDCYFLCGLTCLSEYANIVERLFQYYDLQIGYFLIWLCIDGEWRLVQLDGYIPVGADGKPAFSRTTQDELWVLLLEKAYAKCYGDYNNIAGGQPYEAIKDLSGAPGRTFDHKKLSVNQIWQKLVDANKKQFMMSGGTMADSGQGAMIGGRQQGVTSEGIVLGHAYSILDCQQIKGERILQVRNPWGVTEWGGDWSDKSSKWTNEIKKKLNYKTNDDDGIFWIPLEHYHKNFVTTSINILRPNYYYDSCKQKNVKQLAVKLNTDQLKSACIMASQIDHRHQGLPPNTPYSLMSVIGFILSKEGKILKKIEERRFLYERQGMVQFTQIEEYPSGSEAIAMICLDSSADLIVGYYGDKKIQLEVENDCLQYLQKLAFFDSDNETSQNSGPIKCWLTSVQGIGFLCFQNISNNPINLVVTVKAPQNLQIIYPSKKQNKQTMKPKQVYSVRGKIVDSKKGFNFCQQIQLAN